ncbi:MAG TPA: heme-binding beta-barrel domain-containing protein [Chryseosolibacter sp.]
MRIAFVFLLLPFVSQAQLSKQDSLWLPFQPFLGKWTGSGEGVDGKGTYERTYQFVLNNKYIEVRNKTVYPATPEKPKGYIHEDVGYISYDKGRKTFVFRQFHAEGFVNHYELDSISADKKTMVFVSDVIENIPKGWRARETYVIGNGSLTEIFDLAKPGKLFEPYTRASLLKNR